MIVNVKYLTRIDKEEKMVKLLELGMELNVSR